MKELTIKIPTYDDVKKWLEIAKFKLLGGFRCSECNNKMFFDRISVESEIDGKRFIFEDHAYNQLPRCTSCISKEIAKNENEIFTELHKCDWCGEEKATVTFFNNHKHINIKTNFIFGGNWWNGHYICKDCMVIGLEKAKGSETSSFLVYDKKTSKMYPRNRLGLLKNHNS